MGFFVVLVFEGRLFSVEGNSKFETQMVLMLPGPPVGFPGRGEHLLCVLAKPLRVAVVVKKGTCLSH